MVFLLEFFGMSFSRHLLPQRIPVFSASPRRQGTKKTGIPCSARIALRGNDRGVRSRQIIGAAGVFEQAAAFVRAKPEARESK